MFEEIKCLGHASFYFKDISSGKKIYYADPYSLSLPDLPKADLLFITHAHPDHLSEKDIKKVTKETTIIIAPDNCLEKITWAEFLKKAVLPNNRYTVSDFSFKTVPAYNIGPERQAFHPRENNWVGYIFFLNNKKIYHAGDTDFIPEMEGLKSEQLDLALLPIGGHYTMDAYQAAQAANTIQARYTAPIHYKRLLGDKAKEAEETLKKEVTASEVLLLPELA